MKTLHFFFVLFVFIELIPKISKASNIDSLNHLLEIHVIDTHRVHILNKLATAYLNAHIYDKACKTAQDCITLSKQLDKSNIEANAYWTAGRSFYRLGKRDS